MSVIRSKFSVAKMPQRRQAARKWVCGTDTLKARGSMSTGYQRKLKTAAAQLGNPFDC
jgi:hypothetical protein